MAAFDLAKGTLARAVQAADPDFDRLRDGRFGAAFDTAAVEHSAAMRALRPYYHAFMLWAFRETPFRTVIAADGWLFYAPSLAALREPEASQHFEGRLGEIIDFHRHAMVRGVRCMVLVIPAKWRVYEEQLHGFRPPASRRGLYQHIRDRLLAQGVDAPDVLGELLAARAAEPSRALYLRNDTHLSAEGCAHLVQRLLPRLADLPPELLGQRLAAARRGEPRLHHGDLLDLMGIPAEWAVARRYEAFVRPWLVPPPTDRPGCEVFLMGDSTTRFDDLVLARLIQHATGLSVDARYVGWGILRSREAEAEYEGRPPKVMIFAMGETRFGS